MVGACLTIVTIDASNGRMQRRTGKDAQPPPRGCNALAGLDWERKLLQPARYVPLLIVIVGNFEEKSLALAAIFTAI